MQVKVQTPKRIYVARTLLSKRISDRRYGRDLRRHSLAIRLIRHDAPMAVASCGLDADVRVGSTFFWGAPPRSAPGREEFGKRISRTALAKTLRLSS